MTIRSIPARAITSSTQPESAWRRRISWSSSSQLSSVIPSSLSPYSSESADTSEVTNAFEPLPST